MEDGGWEEGCRGGEQCVLLCDCCVDDGGLKLSQVVLPLVKWMDVSGVPDLTKTVVSVGLYRLICRSVALDIWNGMTESSKGEKVDDVCRT